MNLLFTVVFCFLAFLTKNNISYLAESRNHSHDLSEWSHLHDVLKLLVHVADRELAVLDLVDQLLVVV